MEGTDIVIPRGSPTKVEVKAQTPVWKHILWAVVAVVFIWALAQIPNTIIVFSLAWLISYLLNPAIDAIQGKKLGPIKSASRGTAVALVTALLVGVMVAAGSWVVPQLTDQVQRLLQIQNTISDPMQLPIAIREKVEPILFRLPEGFRQEAMQRAGTFIQEGATKLGIWVSQAISWLGSFLGELLSGIFLVLTAFLVSLYMLMNWHTMGEAFLEKLPRTYRDEVRSLSTKMNQIFGAYIKATILTSIACMIATFISLLLLTWISGNDFPYKGLVSFVAGIAYPIPVIGIIATSILGGVLGYFAAGSLAFGLAVLVVINVVNALIDRTVQPRLMSNAIGVSELFVMFAAFAGGEIAGIWGMLLGIPVAAMGKALFEWFHLQFLVLEEEERTAVGTVRTPAAAEPPREASVEKAAPVTFPTEAPPPPAVETPAEAPPAVETPAEAPPAVETPAEAPPVAEPPAKPVAETEPAPRPAPPKQKSKKRKSE